MPENYKLIEVDPKEVEFSPSNPRGETSEQIKEDPTFIQLVDSVYEYGVLVPVVVHKLPKPINNKRFILIDGERRLRAALKTSAEKIPAHVAESGPSINNLKQAFHIHMLRKQWGNTAQTRALKLMIKELRSSHKKIVDKKLFRELQSLTGYTKSQLNTLRRAAKYSKKILDDVDKGELLWSDLIQFEASFVEQLKQHYPKVLSSLGEKTVRNSLIQKAKRKVLSNTRSLMGNVVPVIARAEKKEEKKFVENLLINFISNEDAPAEEILKQFEKKFPGSQEDILEILENTLETSERLEHLIKSLPSSRVLSYPAKAKELLGRLDSLGAEIGKKRRVLKKVLS